MSSGLASLSRAELRRLEREARAARYLAHLEEGVSTATLAEQDGITHQAVSAFMRGMGLPSSMLEAIREKAQRAAGAETAQPR